MSEFPSEAGRDDWWVPIDDPAVVLTRVGGKGLGLARLASGELPVPAGFTITTAAYRLAAAQCQVAQTVQAAVSATSEAALAAALALVRARLFAWPVPTDLAKSLRDAYQSIGAPAVAVRSSATVEDLPELSFAGQHESYLNVAGEAALVVAMRRCWASLWTTRAHTYRDSMGVPHDEVSMAVVVQALVDADVSGVLFTANPLSGARDEMLINASFGLGDSIVSGVVEPDTWQVDRTRLAIKTATLGAKTTMTVRTDGGTSAQPVADVRRREFVLSTAALEELVGLGVRVEERFDGIPQDIEWARAGGKFWLLQSRAITGLPPPPLTGVAWQPATPKTKLVRRQVVENMPLPLSPLFDELYLEIGLDYGMDHLMASLKLPLDLDEIVERPLFVSVNGYGYCRFEFRGSWRLLKCVPRIVYWYFRSMPQWIRSLVGLWRDEGLADYLQCVDRWRSQDVGTATDEQLLAGIRELALGDAAYWYSITTVVGAAKISETSLASYLAWFVRWAPASGRLLRGYPSKTRDAQTALDGIAARIAALPAARRRTLHAADLEALVAEWAADPATAEIAQALTRYVQQYGHQVFNLDFVDPTLGEDPRLLLVSLRAALADEPAAAPQTAARSTAAPSTAAPSTPASSFETLAEERERLVATTAARLGPVRRWMFTKLLRFAQQFAPFREEALFYMGAGWPTLRRLAGELGRRLTEAGTLSQPGRVYFLRTAELQAACAARAEGEPRAELYALAEQRALLRESRKRLHPPARVPENLRFKLGPFDLTRLYEVWETQKINPAGATLLTGFAVSPGVVTGPAAVVLTPGDLVRIDSGAILVCPTTTPAWTPLFAHAAGLVTDIGAVLAHGSIVAREYGIPAVLGTGSATARIRDGQLIRVDGDAGTVTLIEPAPLSGR